MPTYTEQIEEIRQKRDAETKADPLSWLNLAGLFWLEEGENSFGSDESNKIFLTGFPQGFCGKFIFKENVVTFQPEKDVAFTCNRPNPESRQLISDLDKEPDLISVGSITMKIIIRGDVTLVRAWDRDSAVGRQFTGFSYYPVNEDYRIRASYVRYESPKIVKRLDMIGTETEGQFLGLVQFSLHGIDCTLEAEKSGEKLLLHFTDSTSKVTTYGGGRKFSITAPEGDEVILDFNLANNWQVANGV